MHEFTWRSRQANRSIEIQRLRGVATTARPLRDIHVTVLAVVSTAVVSDRMPSHTKKLPRIVHTTRDATNHLGSDAPLEMVRIETRLRAYCTVAFYLM
jgi:DNA-binding IclR family transcriptional regulator